MESYSATNGNEIMAFAGKWKELENIMMSEVAQTQKKILHVLYNMLILALNI